MRSISYPRGAEIWLNSRHALLKDFAAYAQQLTERVKAHAIQAATEAHHQLINRYRAARKLKPDSRLRAAGRAWHPLFRRYQRWREAGYLRQAEWLSGMPGEAGPPA